MSGAEPDILRRTDVATSAVVREAMSSIVREMRRAMVQSSYSSIIYEGYDFSCVLIDGRGRLVANPARTIHSTSSRSRVRSRGLSQSMARSAPATSCCTMILIRGARTSTMSR